MGTLAAHAGRYLLERRNRQELSRSSAMRVSYILLSLDKSFGDRPLKTFSGRAIERWSEANPHWKASTRNTYLNQVRTFCRWLLKRKLIRLDPFAELKMPRRPRPSPRPLPRDDITALLRAVPDARARLIVHLQWGLGLRCCGCANLKVEDIDLVNRTLCVTEKFGVERRLPITPEVEAEIDRYLFQHPATSGPLLRSYRHAWEPLTAKYIGKLVAYWMTLAGVKRGPFDGVSAHALRRTALTEVAEACGDAFVVAELAGWASIQTAVHYVRRASTERVRAALEAR
jgi:integrase